MAKDAPVSSSPAISSEQVFAPQVVESEIKQERSSLLNESEAAQVADFKFEVVNNNLNEDFMNRVAVDEFKPSAELSQSHYEENP